jgi:hypothetical protein
MEIIPSGNNDEGGEGNNVIFILGQKEMQKR